MALDVDIFISGGGIAGLSAAAALSEMGFSVLLADPTSPPKDHDQPKADLRSTAYLQSARALFQRAGVWEQLLSHATALQTLRVIDTAGQPAQITAERAFQASELSDAPFGWNIPNWQARQILSKAVEGRVDLRFGTGFESIFQRDREVRIKLTDGTNLRARLAVAADGRTSPIRDALGIGVSTTRYGQKALAFSVSHDIPHENISTEIYLRGGAFTLVPLPDYDGKPASSVVWMEDARIALDLAARPVAEFNAMATERSVGVLGSLSRIGAVAHWPVVTQTAARLTDSRVALLAEAAHVMPPIGAQGLNTSLQDIAALVEAIGANPGDPGAPATLRAFADARDRDIRLRAKVIDVFNRVCRSDRPAVQALRTAGLKLVHDVAPVRRAVMAAGLGRNRA